MNLIKVILFKTFRVLLLLRFRFVPIASITYGMDEQ